MRASWTQTSLHHFLCFHIFTIFCLLPWKSKPFSLALEFIDEFIVYCWKYYINASFTHPFVLIVFEFLPFYMRNIITNFSLFSSLYVPQVRISLDRMTKKNVLSHTFFHCFILIISSGTCKISMFIKCLLFYFGSFVVLFYFPALIPSICNCHCLFFSWMFGGSKVSQWFSPLLLF